MTETTKEEGPTDAEVIIYGLPGLLIFLIIIKVLFKILMRV